MCDYDCFNCPHSDCIIENVTLTEKRQQDRFDRDLLPLEPEKRSKRNYELSEKGRIRRRKYFRRKNKKLPNCDKCEHCKVVINCNGDNDIRLCTRHWQLIDKKVSTSPKWCEKRVQYKKEKENGTCVQSDTSVLV